ncbi:hypothetical protein G6F50_015263 [Rhizopus delemar]|uniref:Uncharacterized protein n=1 Tax=Rhizopus delemar TaxID=936053 RepID=A0A9P6XZ57_9FUNG|nr:hypothetical protein G6F50_015263 [Rhizopus delemar]
MHQVEGVVDLVQVHGVGDERRQFDIALHRVLDHAGQLAATLHAAEGGAHPLAAGHQLERTGGDLLARTGHAAHHALAPATVRAFQRRAHHVDVADAFKAVVHAPGGHFNDDLLDGLVVVLRVDAVGSAELAGQLELGRIGIHRDDAAGLGLARTLDHRQAAAADAAPRPPGAGRASATTTAAPAHHQYACQWSNACDASIAMAMPAGM